MERILEDASGDSDQRRDGDHESEENNIPATETAARGSLDITFSPELDSLWKQEPVNSTNAFSSDTKSENPIFAPPEQPVVAPETESRPVVLREIETNNAGPESHANRPFAN